MLRHVTLRQLRAFETVAKQGSYTAAAESMHITQPTLSQQIKKLTDYVGVPLLEQIGKKVYVTDAGHALLSTIREVFTSLDKFEAEIAAQSGLRKGTLKISAVTASEFFLPRLIGVFSQRYPDIKVVLKIINRQAVLQRLEQNRDDLYILAQPPEELDIVATPFLDNSLVVVAPYDHPLTRKRHISLQEIAKQRFITREPGSGTRRAIEKLFTEQNLRFDPGMELGSNEAIKQGVIGGLGISALSRFYIQHELKNEEIAVLDVKGFPLSLRWQIVYLKQKRFSSVAKTFYEYLLDVNYWDK